MRTKVFLGVLLWCAVLSVSPSKADEIIPLAWIADDSCSTLFPPDGQQYPLTDSKIKVTATGTPCVTVNAMLSGTQSYTFTATVYLASQAGQSTTFTQSIPGGSSYTWDPKVSLTKTLSLKEGNYTASMVINIKANVGSFTGGPTHAFSVVQTCPLDADGHDVCGPYPAEPSSIVLLGSGIVGLAGLVRRRIRPGR
jgi:hypothetical protein